MTDLPADPGPDPEDDGEDDGDAETLPGLTVPNTDDEGMYR